MAHAFEMSDVVPGAPPPPPPPLPPLTLSPDPAVSAQAKRATVAVKSSAGEATAAAKRKGRRATLLTGPLGLTEEAELKRKTLLGA